jgi:hypothetical protein
MDKIVFSLNYSTDKREGEFITEAFPHPFSTVKHLYGYADTVILTRSQLEELLGGAWDASARYTGDWGNVPTKPNKEQYISSIINSPK